ncbi:hypothetical protein Q0Z83_077220 [Actinoplanes sichuanensis]|uniref:Lipoprotein n=1 Tax=Actinoplanes sichuanensis TaxID=512349 RepID=A0ABW4AE78_9ACTN|nr:hypothetical protein [Actinoplanes sichuanensis]BEL09531.1 hypothetical protein Q0Z83_077220 [Actinoplanes sichuanensis]
MRKLVIAGLLLLTAACSPARTNEPTVASVQKGTTTPAPSASASFDPDAPLKHAKCMREHGMTWFPDPPPPGEGQALEIPNGTDQKAFDAAMKACEQYLRNAVDKGGPNAEDIERLRDFAKCMRANGMPDFPDPKADGSSEIRIEEGDDAKFAAAEKACEQYKPEGAQRQVAGGPQKAGGN